MTIARLPPIQDHSGKEGKKTKITPEQKPGFSIACVRGKMTLAAMNVMGNQILIRSNGDYSV